MNKECRRTLTTMLFFEIGYLRSGLIMDINHAFLSDSLRVKNINFRVTFLRFCVQMSKTTCVNMFLKIGVHFVESIKKLHR